MLLIINDKESECYFFYNATKVGDIFFLPVCHQAICVCIQITFPFKVKPSLHWMLEWLLASPLKIYVSTPKSELSNKCQRSTVQHQGEALPVIFTLYTLPSGVRHHPEQVTGFSATRSQRTVRAQYETWATTMKTRSVCTDCCWCCNQCWSLCLWSTVIKFELLMV